MELHTRINTLDGIIAGVNWMAAESVSVKSGNSSYIGPPDKAFFCRPAGIPLRGTLLCRAGGHAEPGVTGSFIAAYYR
jgi:hypothetical protein